MGNLWLRRELQQANCKAENALYAKRCQAPCQRPSYGGKRFAFPCYASYHAPRSARFDARFRPKTLLASALLEHLILGTICRSLPTKDIGTRIFRRDGTNALAVASTIRL